MRIFTYWQKMQLVVSLCQHKERRNYLENLAELRRKAGLTQEELGRKIGVSKWTILRWEKGYVNPDVDDINKIHAAIHDWKTKDFSITVRKGEIMIEWNEDPAVVEEIIGYLYKIMGGRNVNT